MSALSNAHLEVLGNGVYVMAGGVRLSMLTVEPSPRIYSAQMVVLTFPSEISRWSIWRDEQEHPITFEGIHGPPTIRGTLTPHLP